MIHWGINALNHGSSLAVFENERLRSFDIFKDQRLEKDSIRSAFINGGPSKIFWYERPWLKKLRQARAGQWHRVVDFDDLPSRYLQNIGVGYADIIYTPHHASHAAAGYYTSPFDHCAIVVLDAIGEFECASIWEGRGGCMKKLWSRSYPNSLGLFYSAFTRLVGLTPVQDEYLLEKMSQVGNSYMYLKEVTAYIEDELRLTKNLHRGVNDWPYEITNLDQQCDIAAAVQHVFEQQIAMIMSRAKQLTNDCDSLVYMGGCAMNITANKKIVEPMWRRRWSLPNPTDASSSIGAVAYHIKEKIKYPWNEPKHIAINI